MLGVEINGRKIPPPPQVEINKNNISKMQGAMLESYIQTDSSPNAAIRKEYGKYYSIIHDSIQMFSKELNAVFLRTVLMDNGVKIVNIPWGLTEIDGGSLDSEKLVTHLF